MTHERIASDATYPVSPIVNGKRKTCNYYRTWRNMLKRCYNAEYLKKNPSYEGCSVHPKWHSFMEFRSWMKSQDWEGKHLDKDILLSGNKIYSPDTCAFVRPETNKFLTDRALHRGEYLIGVSFYPKNNKFRAQVTDGRGKVKHIGYYLTEKDAHTAWLMKKVEISEEVASKESDVRVIQAILDKYRNYEVYNAHT